MRQFFFIFALLQTFLPTFESTEPSIELVSEWSDSELINYAAESRGYPEQPDALFVTCRGGGMTVLNATLDPTSQGFIVARWHTSRAVEGQDRRGDLLIVTELGRGPSGPIDGAIPALHLFSGISQQLLTGNLAPTHTIDLSSHIDAILHAKLLRAQDGSLFAVCTGGFSASTSGAVVVVSLSDPASAQVVVLETPVAQPEGVMIVNDTSALIGGINSTLMAVVDLRTPLHPILLSTAPDMGSQLVAAKWDDQPVASTVGRNRVIMADWGVPGGIVSMDVSDPLAPFTEWKHKSQRLSKANRIKLFDHFAFVPLEQAVGAFAVIDLDDHTDYTVHRVPLSLSNTKVYCLAVTPDSRVFLFVAETSTMYIYNITFER